MKRIWDMDLTERLVERSGRYKAYAEFFRRKGAKVELRAEQLIVETPQNNYLIEILPTDPRFVSIEVVYEIVPGDIKRAASACYKAQAHAIVAKARTEPYKNGYILRFAVETIQDTTQGFMDVADLQFACLEDCRSKYLEFMKESIDSEFAGA